MAPLWTAPPCPTRVLVVTFHECLLDVPTGLVSRDAGRCPHGRSLTYPGSRMLTPQPEATSLGCIPVTCVLQTHRAGWRTNQGREQGRAPSTPGSGPPA